MKTIAYQGVKGAFSYITALKNFGPDNNYIGIPTFREVFDLVNRNKADYAVIPIENSLVGSIYENYDLMNSYEMHIIGEHFTKVEHCLLTVQGSQEEDILRKIRKVFSHPKALEQCASFFRNHPWIEAVVHTNTAVAAAEVALKNDPTCAAIASDIAGDLYGLQILQRGLEDDHNNYTRFVTVTKEDTINEHADKCSLMLQLNHVPGALANILKLFAERDINLTKIESRPLKGSLFEYLFYIDLEFTRLQRSYIVELLEKLCGKVQKLKILGFYKKEALHG